MLERQADVDVYFVIHGKVARVGSPMTSVSEGTSVRHWSVLRAGPPRHVESAAAGLVTVAVGTPEVLLITCAGSAIFSLKQPSVVPGLKQCPACSSKVHAEIRLCRSQAAQTLFSRCDDCCGICLLTGKRSIR